MKSAEEVKRLGRVIQLMAEELTDVSGTCPPDCRDVDWLDCETVCAQVDKTQDEIMASCWLRYFEEKEKELNG